VLLGVLLPVPALSAPADDSRFELAPQGAAISSSFVPQALDPSPVTIVLELAGDPVAVRKAKAPGKKIDRETKQGVERDLKGRQDALRDAIESQGGKVVAEFQDALNGIKVEAPRNKIRALAGLPNVVRVRPVATFTPDNVKGVPLIGGPQVWDGADGFHGEGIKIGIIDSGIDYTHANFGGPGTPDAYSDEHARAAAGEQPDLSMLGPDAPKVKGGTDLVGDDYDAGSGVPARRIPHPRPSPLDCNPGPSDETPPRPGAGGHGSHVSGTAAGLGVTADGETFTGPYTSSTLNQPQVFAIGPGVAPLADLYAIRVFGCFGSSAVVVDAINWAVANEMDVINMSLGSNYGTADDATALASTNAAAAGLLVVASAGNSGPVPYITGSPATGSGAISVAAIDPAPTFANGATVTLGSGRTLEALNANSAKFADGTTFQIIVLRNPNGSVSLGCNEAEYRDALIAGKLVVTLRGVCARVDRPTFGEKHGAAAVAMINDSDGFPPDEGTIPGVTIPFLGISGVGLAKGSDGEALVGADGTAVTLTNARVTNPTFGGFAGFSSNGPRGGDSALKPDISAPGLGIVSTRVATGNRGRILSGTSMAAPHVTGAAALTLQAHREWGAEDVRAAVVNTGDPTKMADPARPFGYKTSRGGSGLAQVLPATRTRATAVTPDGATNLSFGFDEPSGDFQGARHFEVRNHGDTPITFNVSVVIDRPANQTPVVDPATVTVGAGGREPVTLTLNVPAAAIGDSRAFREVSGVVTLRPAGAGNGGATLRVPYLLVPRGRSNVQVQLDHELSLTQPSATATITNPQTAFAGTADVYAWGLFGEDQGLGSIDLRAVGVQAFDHPRFGRFLVFAVNTHERWSSASVIEFDIPIDTKGTGKPNLLLVGADLGLLTGAGFSGQMATAVFDLSTGRGRLLFLADAPTDASTILLPLRASDLGMTADQPRFSYGAQVFRLFTNQVSTIADTAAFDAFQPTVSQGQFVRIAPNGTQTIALSLVPEEFPDAPALGVMVVASENRAGGDQARLIPIRGG